MRLTNSLRDAFIDSVMEDVPQQDYRQQITDRVNLLHKQIMATLGIVPAHFERLASNWLYIESMGFSARGLLQKENESIANDDICRGLYALYTKQKKDREALEQKLHGVVYGCTTTQQLLEALPQFEKYIPAEPEKSRQLPVTTGVVKAFKQAGWPKGKEKAT